MINIFNRLKGSLGTALLSFCIVLMLFLMFFIIKDSRRNSRENKDKIEKLASTIATMNDSLKTIKFKNLAGKETNVTYVTQIKEISPVKEKDTKEIIHVSTKTHDTIKVASKEDKNLMRTINYNDNYLELKIKSYRDSAIINYLNRDTIDIYNFIRFRHHFLFFRWGKEEKVNALSRNKHSIITKLNIIRRLK